MPINGPTTTIDDDIDQYNGRITTFVILSCMVASLGGVIFGYEIGISGNISSMEPFLKEFFPIALTEMKNATGTNETCRTHSHLLSTFASFLYIVAMIASLAATPINQKYGRKVTIAIGGVVSLAGAGVGGGAMCVPMLVLSRVLLGVGIGFANQAVPIYLTEMALPKYRGAFLCGFQFSIAIGFILANLINFVIRNSNFSYSWRAALSLSAIPSSFLTIAVIFLPNTATTLIHTDNNLQKAVGMLQRIRGTTEILTELNDIASSNNPVSSYKSIIQKKYRPHLVMAIAIPLFAHMTGFNLLAFYTPIMLRSVASQEMVALISVVALGIIGSCANIAAMVVVDKLGRRALFMIGGAHMLVAHVMIGGVVATTGKDFKEYMYFKLVMMSVFVVGFQLSWGPLGRLVPCEMMPQEIRSMGQSITEASNFLFAFCSAQILVGPVACCCKVGMFFFFGVCIVAMSGFVYFMLPETKSVPMEQMEVVWRRHWFWRRMMTHDT